MTRSLNDSTDRELCREIYERFSETLFEGSLTKENGIYRKLFARYLGLLEDFVEAAVRTNDRPFALMIKPDGTQTYDQSDLAKSYFKHIPVFLQLLAELSKRYSYSEHVEIFREACASLSLDDPSLIREDNWYPLTFSHPSGMDGAMCFNALCAILRKDWSEKGYKTRFRRRAQEARNRSREYCRYIDRWFDRLASIIVLRVDLAYLAQYRQKVTLDELRSDFDHLYNNARKNKLFSGWRGYIAKIEYGLGKGLHMHLILLFDTQSKQAIRHAYLAKRIGEYWNTVITKGRGSYWNCNANIKKYDAWGKLGIGPIHVDDSKTIQNLKERVVSYLCKMDQFIRPYGCQETQLIRRGNWPKPEPKKRGAPRRRKITVTETRGAPDMAGLQEAVDSLGY